MNSGYVDVIVSSYVDWLIDRIEARERGYLKLIHKLWLTPFEWFILGDDNRCEDGKALRALFGMETGTFNPYEEEPLEFECTMLEMIFAISFRINDLSDLYTVTSEVEWFWEILNNLELLYYSDDEWDVRDGDIVVGNILETVNNRTYMMDGLGGLFPLDNVDKDWSKVEIWYQMQAYIQMLESREP